jgi:hypothetical protein
MLKGAHAGSLFTVFFCRSGFALDSSSHSLTENEKQMTIFSFNVRPGFRMNRQARVKKNSR